MLPVRGTKQPSIKDFTRTRKYYELATNAPSQIQRRIAKFADHNIGLVPGPRLVVIDIETGPALQFIARVLGCSPAALLTSTRTVRTGGGGYHLYYDTGNVLYKNHTARHLRDQEGNQLPIEIKAWMGFVMAPPSVSSKGVYSFIHEVDPAPIPAALHELLAEIGLVRLGPGMVIPPPPPPPTSVAGWDKDEYADRDDHPPPPGERQRQKTGIGAHGERHPRRQPAS